MSELETLPAETIPDVEEVTETGEPAVAHIVKVGPGESAAAKVLEARINGTPIEALCGHVWVPSRDPKQLPVCQKCKDVYGMYRDFNDGLDETPPWYSSMRLFRQSVQGDWGELFERVEAALRAHLAAEGR